MLANFRLKNESETPTSKTELPFFLTNKRLSAGTVIYVRILIYQKAIYKQK